MKIVVTSDWHLDAVTAGVDRFEDITSDVDHVVRQTIEGDADLFLFLGDLCDPGTSRSHRAVAYSVGVARLLHENGIPSVWLTGNHDVIEDGRGSHTLMALRESGYTVIDRPTLHPAPQPLGGASPIDILGLPFTARSERYDPDRFVRGCHRDRDCPLLVIGHLTHPEAHPGSETEDFPRGRDEMWPIDAIREVFPYALVIGGHYHEAQELGGVMIVGAPSRFTFGEQNLKPGFLILEC